jgi:hypothetical protein
MKTSQRSCERIWREAESYPASATPGEIRQLSESKKSHEKLLCLFLMRRRIAEGDPASTYLSLARPLIRDSDSNCRWQAAIVVGESIATDPDAVWQVVLECGEPKDADMRSAIAFVLLEHLLESDFDRYFSLLREEVREGRRWLLDVLSMCCLFGEDAEDRKKTIAKYMRRATRGLPHKKHK